MWTSSLLVLNPYEAICEAIDIDRGETIAAADKPARGLLRRFIAQLKNKRDGGDDA